MANSISVYVTICWEQFLFSKQLAKYKSWQQQKVPDNKTASLRHIVLHFRDKK